MKRLGILAILVLVLFSSCFISNWESTRWEGDLSDMTEGLYNLTISQSGKNLVFTVQVNDEKLAELIADLDDDEEFTPPDEIFVWMNPTFVDGDNHIYNGMSNIMFPVGRKTVGADFYSDSTVEYDTDGVTRLDANTNTSVQIVVSLEDIANDWFRDWLGTDDFDGDTDEYSTDNDMNGVYGLVADNYIESWDTWETASFPLADGTESESKDFGFNKSAPYGYGYSEVASISSDDWIPVIITENGLSISTESVYGGVPFIISLQLEEGSSISSDISLVYGEYSYYYYLNSWNCNTADSETGLYTWKIVYWSNEYTQEDIDTNGGYIIYLPALNINSYYTISYYIGMTYSSIGFNYLGLATTLFGADFESGYDLTGTATTGTETLTLGIADTYHPDDGTTIVSNDYNNWGIDTLDNAGLTAGLSATGSIVGVGTGGDLTYGYYDNYRYDTLEFPAFDFWGLYYDNNYNSTGFNGSVYVTFDLYKDLDYNWSDYLSVEIECWDSYWNGSEYVYYTYWNQIGYKQGPKESSDNNGWTSESFYFSTYYMNNYYDSGYYYGRDQRIRLKFYSDAYGSGKGVFIDNLKIVTVE